MPNGARQIRIPHVKSSTYQAAPIDGAVVSILKDAVGTTFSLTLTRIEGLPSVEILPGTLEQDDTGISIKQEGSSTFEGSIQKIQEFTAILRPDRAFEIAQAILIDLARLDNDQLKRYGIPRVKLLPSQDAKEKDPDANQ